MKNQKHLVKQVSKFHHTIRLYHSTWCDQWTISITKPLSPENTMRRVISPSMAAHIIAKVHTF